MFHKIPPVPTNARSSSTDNINTRFSPADWHGQFNSNANDYFQPPPIRRKPLHSQSPITTTFQDHSKSNGVPSSNSNQDPTSPAGPDREPFRPEFWTEELKQHTWDPQPTPQTSPKRSAPMSRKVPESRVKSFRGTSGTRSTRRAAVPKPATVSTASEGSDSQESPSESTSARAMAEESPASNVNDEGSAMDIDPITPSNERQEDSTPATSNGMSGTDLNDTTRTGKVEPGMKPPTSNRTSPPPGESHVETNGVPPSSKLNLDNLKKVEPFIQSTGQGLKDMQDLSSTLPFESRASITDPLTPLAPRQLQLPKPPKCPPVPPKLTQTTWEQYLATMQVYMYEWNLFVDLMLAHFQERQVETKERLTPNWMSILGEGPKGGYLKYMQGVEEDFRVREHYDVAWEKHREGMWAFGKIRAGAVEKALKSV